MPFRFNRFFPLHLGDQLDHATLIGVLRPSSEGQ
jgi:hypothetical protein